MAEEIKHTIEKAIAQLKKDSKENFDATIELHINLEIDPKKQDEQIRYTTMLPNGTGKEIKVAVMSSSKVAEADLELSEADLKKIETGKIKIGTDFDVLVAEPKMMSKLGRIARILGPAGVMPNPKNGTVAEDVKKAVEQIKKGKIEIKTEQIHPIIHTIIGKVSFDDKKLVENYSEVMKSLNSHKPQKVGPEFITNAFISSTMGKPFQIELEKLKV